MDTEELIGRGKGDPDFNGYPGQEEELDLEVVNKFTGEVFSVKVLPGKIDSLVGTLLQVKKQKDALDDLEFKLKGLLEINHLSKNDYRPLSSSLGYDVRYIESASKLYDLTTVWNHLDHDMLFTSGAIQVANAKLEKLMGDLVRVNGLTAEDSHAILETVILKAKKPYVKLEKVSA